MSYRPHGKHVRIDVDNPDALGICDYSGFVFNRRDMVRQMDWRGNALVWTGFYVGACYADVPNEQARPPILPPDPVPVKYPRLKQPQTQTFSDNPYPIFSDITNFAFNDMEDNQDGINALPEDARLYDLQNFYWGA